MESLPGYDQYKLAYPPEWDKKPVADDTLTCAHCKEWLADTCNGEPMEEYEGQWMKADGELIHPKCAEEYLLNEAS